MLMSLAFLASALVQFGLGLVLAALLGPGEFGLYAIGFAAAVLAQTLFYEPLRLAITRFAGGGGALPPMFRVGFVVPLLLAGLVLGFLLLRGGDRTGLLAAGLITAVIVGLAECRAAWLRAHFAETSYAVLLLLRTGLSLVLMPMAAIVLKRGDAVLAAFALSILLAALLHRALFREPLGKPGGDFPNPVALMAYALPIVGTNFAYVAMLLALRLFMAQEAGLAEAGRFSLALDLSAKLVTTLGAGLDLWLFQLALRAEREQGKAAGQRQLTLNSGRVMALLAPAMLGLWLVLPSLEILLVAPDFRGSFAWHAALLAPGLLLYGGVQYALHPVHQMARRTTILMVAAFLALFLALLVMALAPAFRLPPAMVPALALLGAMSVAFLLLAWWRDRNVPLFSPGLPLHLLLALGAMLLAVAPMRFVLNPGAAVLIASVVVGVIAYGAVAWSLDLAGLRGLLADWRAKTKNGASPPRSES
jgi:O-antigen/teichoic acid export membrane protein